ncbi:PREDICTED: uncharacterized protein LOC104819451 [Tarenaya hassleriana]|uniref:uncharacterized protein LOC104819451 n=1 Tax=Tarenaya hassleriana TaxID=28532 RepID=UPI00053C991F|nr:PREDICTED: uncharacterized protein LOC104819451 [Tarenaya hassleriana]
MQTLSSNEASTNGQVDLLLPEHNLSDQNPLGGLAEVSYDASNFKFNHNEMQGEASSRNPEPEESTFEMSNLYQAIIVEDVSGVSNDNTSQVGSNGKTLNSASASASASATEIYAPATGNNPNQEQNVGDFVELPYFNQEWGEDDFMDSLLDYGMH